MAQNLVENVVNCPMENARRTDHFPPSLWGDQFMNFTLDTKLAEAYSKAIEVLKDEVKIILTSPESKMIDIMNLIETLERLGVSYHFENEIEEKLENFFNLHSNYEDEVYDLYTISLHFRLFRQHGYSITSDIFSKFKDDVGEFKESLKSDARGLLSLYEAVHLRMHGEYILEEALDFAKDNLKSMAQNLRLPLKKQVERALYQPLHLGYPRLETHHYISIYEEEESKNESLLKFAKLDYNLVQMLHKQELCEVSRWWKELDLASKLPYARDRIVEGFYWSMGAFHEPRYSRARIMLTKFIKFLSVIDDTYDAYGTIEELYTFTEAIQRWDINTIDQLPDYMKPLYRTLLELHEQFAEELAKEGRSYAVKYTIESLKELTRSYYVEAKWLISGYLPSFAEYLSNALITCAYIPFLNVAMLGIENIKKDDFEWLNKKPRMLVACLEVTRLMDDIGSYENEKERGQITSGIDSYMAENDVTKEEAMNNLFEVATNAWKDINECLLKPFSCSKDALMTILNITRSIEVIYKNRKDGYTKPGQVTKSHITALYIDPLKI